MRSSSTGPVITTGNINPVQNMEPEQGPSLTFQGGHIYDSRFVGNSGAAPGLPGTKDFGLWCSPYVTNVDGVPIAKTTGLIAAGQATVAATPMTLASAEAAGLSIAIPVVPWSAGMPTKIEAASKVNVLALDFGFATCNITTGTPNVTNLPTGAWKFLQQKGMKVIISGAGATGALPLIAGILTPPAINATTMTLDTNAGTTSTGGRIGTADPSGVAAWPFIQAGTGIAIGDPTQMIARAVSISGNAGSTAQNFTVAGYDIWGNPMTEVIAFAGGAATTNGKKAFKYIASVTPASTDAGHLLSVDTTDIFGFSIRSDFWEYANIYWNGGFITSSTGYVAAIATKPSTNALGDTRGTYAVQSASDGTKRLAIFSSVPSYNLANANNLDFATLFGVTPA